MKNIVVLVSGGGTNLQALIDAQNSGILKSGKITTVISSKLDAFALKRAEEAGIATKVLPRRGYENSQRYSQALINMLQGCKADLVVMAGFMVILEPVVSKAFPNKIINVHPSLIPSFCGEGYFGIRVHEAVLKSGVKLTGATVHFVNEVVDGGAIILQKAVKVEEFDTPQSLQKRVMEQAEWEILPKVAELFCSGKIKIEGTKAIVSENI